jgi:hypothetical protein
MLLRQLLFPMANPPPRIRLEYEDVETVAFGGMPMTTRQRVNWQTTNPPILAGSGLNAPGNNQNPIANNKQINPFEMLVILFKSVLCWYIIYTANLVDGMLGAPAVLIGTGIARYRLFDPVGGTPNPTTNYELWPRDQSGFLHFAFANSIAGAGGWSPHGPVLFAKEYNKIRFIYIDSTAVAVANSQPTIIQITASAPPVVNDNLTGYIVLWGYNNGGIQPLSVLDMVTAQLLYTFNFVALSLLSGYYAISIIAPEATALNNQVLTWTVNTLYACDSFAHKPSPDVVTNGTFFSTMRVPASACQMKTIAAPEADEGTMTFVPLPPGSTNWDNFVIGYSPTIATSYLTDYMMNWKNNYLKAILEEGEAGGYMVPKPHGIDEFKLKQPFQVSLSVNPLVSAPYIEDYVDSLDPDYEVVLCCINTQNIIYGSSTGGSAADFIMSFGISVEGESENRLLESLKMPINSDEVFKEALKKGMRAKQFGSNNFEVWDLLQNIPAISLGVAGGILGGPAGALAGYAGGKFIQGEAKRVFEGEGGQPPVKKTRGKAAAKHK